MINCRAPRLKSLRLITCKITTQVLTGAVTALPMLEELELSICASVAAAHQSGRASGHSLAETCRALAKACPLLKRLRLNKYCFHRGSDVRDSEAMEITEMRGLRCLQLFGNNLSNVGLEDILGGCSLDIRHCFNVEVNDETRLMCARLQTLRLPDNSMDGYDLSFGSPYPEMNVYPGIPGLGFPTIL
uniref:Uncharacterized protein n=1 Tax=Saccharum officinarum TaxID=4547 RepID=A0A678TGX6_SACOF|nr:hypothetical protein SO62J10_000007 [Saccharum officinarum]